MCGKFESGREFDGSVAGMFGDVGGKFELWAGKLRVEREFEGGKGNLESVWSLRVGGTLRVEGDRP